MKLRYRWLTVFGLCLAAASAHAQWWPTKSIRAIVPFAPGTGTDGVARPVLNQMAKQLGQPIVIDNRPGAAGTIGMAAVAQAEPDGYTILVHSNSFTIIPSTYTKLSFDPVNDFAGVLPLASLPMVVVAPAKGYRNIGELVAAGRARPGLLSYASAGAGGAIHLGAERLRLAGGFEGVHIPYKGSPEALTDVITGRVDFYLSPVGLALQHVRSGRLAALAVSSSRRSAALPGVPTTVEAGLANSDYDIWVGMMVPAKTLRPVVARLAEEAAKAIESEEVTQKFRAFFAEPMPMSNEQFEALLKREVSINARLVKAAGVTVN